MFILSWHIYADMWLWRQTFSSLKHHCHVQLLFTENHMHPLRLLAAVAKLYFLVASSLSTAAGNFEDLISLLSTPVPAWAAIGPVILIGITQLTMRLQFRTGSAVDKKNSAAVATPDKIDALQASTDDPKKDKGVDIPVPESGDQDTNTSGNLSSQWLRGVSIVYSDGVVREKDHGKGTDAILEKIMRKYNPSTIYAKISLAVDAAGPENSLLEMLDNDATLHQMTLDFIATRNLPRAFVDIRTMMIRLLACGTYEDDSGELIVSLEDAYEVLDVLAKLAPAIGCWKYIRRNADGEWERTDGAGTADEDGSQSKKIKQLEKENQTLKDLCRAMQYGGYAVWEANADTA